MMISSASNTTVSYSDLQKFVHQLFRASGLGANEAETATSVILYSESRGLKSHGLKNLIKIYLPQLLDKSIDSLCRNEIVRDTGPLSLINAHQGMGLVVGHQAMEVAISKAKRYGVGAVLVSNSSHFGSAGYYTHLATQKGLIGAAASNLGSQIITPPPKGTIAMLGTNPLSLAAPGGKFPPFCLDMSTTVTSTGSLREKRDMGREVPLRQLRRLDGTWTTDPNDYFRGVANLVFLGSEPHTGEMKGFGLALAVDILCGVLTGSSFGPRKELFLSELIKLTPPKSDIGHLFLALDPSFIHGSYEVFIDKMEEILGTLLSCPSLSEEEITYPGYREEITARESFQNGIALTEELRQDLFNFAYALNVDSSALQVDIFKNLEKEVA